jgi:hypothetical protein
MLDPFCTYVARSVCVKNTQRGCCYCCYCCAATADSFEQCLSADVGLEALLKLLTRDVGKKRSSTTVWNATSQRQAASTPNVLEA